MRLTVLYLAAFTLGVNAFAEVADSAAGGFTSKISVPIQAAPDAVYAKILHIGDWWDSAHTFSGDAHNLNIDAKPMGCFCEKLPNSGAVRHMEVITLIPGKTLVLTGGLGPLQSMAVAANMTFQLTPTGGGTKLDVTYAVTGYSSAGLNALSAPVDGVLTQQITRLKNYIEHGSPKPQ